MSQDASNEPPNAAEVVHSDRSDDNSDPEPEAAPENMVSRPSEAAAPENSIRSPENMAPMSAESIAAPSETPIPQGDDDELYVEQSSSGSIMTVFTLGLTRPGDFKWTSLLEILTNGGKRMILMPWPVQCRQPRNSGVR